MTLQSYSRAGKIRAALSELGWDADSASVAALIGPVTINEFTGWSKKNRKTWRHFDGLVQYNEINFVRRKFRPKNVKANPRRVIDVSDPKAEYFRIIAGK